jgi:hypothetical protein
VGGIRIEQVYRAPGFEGYIPGCTLGFTGVVGGTPVVLTAWLCINWTGTDRTRGQAELYQPYRIRWNLIADSIVPTCRYNWIFNNLLTSCDVVVMRSTVPREPRVFRPTESSTPQYGQVVRKLGKFDVWLFSELAKAGITTDVTRGRLILYCFDGIYTGQRWGNLTFNVIVGCNALTTIYVQPGDSGSPVYRFEGSNDRLGAYGIVSGAICVRGTDICIASLVSTIDYYELRVDVDPTR